jgi:glycine betaine/proline transport system permease protein
MFVFLERETIPLDNWIERGVDWLVSNNRGVFQAIKMPIEYVLTNIESFLLWVPPSILILAVAVLAWWVAGWKISVFTLLSLLFMALIGIWDEAMITLSMILCSFIFCTVVGIPLGIICSQSDMFFNTLRPIMDAMQSTPAFVYLVPVVILFSIGTVSGIIATIIQSIPPIIRLTNVGIRQVHPELVEAATAFGATRMQLLIKVQIPLALPSIMTGLNQNIMLALAMVVIASLIGAGGLGLLVYEGVNSLKIGLAGVGGLGIVLIAMVLDRITMALGETQKDRDRISGHHH